MTLKLNPWRGIGIDDLDAYPDPSRNVDAVASLIARCPAHAETPLVTVDGLSKGTLLVKDERTRMGLGSFKALGAAYVIAHAAAARDTDPGPETLRGETYVAASAGNHGLSLAAGARLFGARAIIYLADTVPEGFAIRLRAIGADVVRVGDIYEASLDKARVDAAENGWTLLSDSSWEGYTDLPVKVMEGYLQMASEALTQAGNITHAFLQAGVGGLAAGVTAHIRDRLGNAPKIIVVEPAHAPAIHASLAAGTPVHAPGPVSEMGRLDCKDPSLIALKELAREADFSMTITEDQAARTVEALRSRDLTSTPSGVAGIAGLLSLTEAQQQDLGLSETSRILTILSEAASE